METKDGWGIITWHFCDVLNESLMFKIVWNVIIELSNGVIEAVVWSQALFVNPSVTVVIEKFSIKIICDSTTILYLSNHISNSFP